MHGMKEIIQEADEESKAEIDKEWVKVTKR